MLAGVASPYRHTDVFPLACLLAPAGLLPYNTHKLSQSAHNPSSRVSLSWCPSQQDHHNRKQVSTIETEKSKNNMLLL